MESIYKAFRVTTTVCEFTVYAPVMDEARAIADECCHFGERILSVSPK